MELYDEVANASSALFTKRFSTSFSLASRLFPTDMRQHIYNIYGLVRLADEIVDTYNGTDQAKLLDALEADTYAAVDRGYSTNLTLHAYALTARTFQIDQKLVTAFFTSMRMDLSPQTYDQKQYETYIYGSAEVVGLMCLYVFCNGNKTQYKQLESGARALGSAFQKVNFLRDVADDQQRLHRMYFPGVTFENFDEVEKSKIIADIRRDFSKAAKAIPKLPAAARTPVRVAYNYYSQLLKKLERTPVAAIKTERVRLPDSYKLWLLTKTYISSKVMD